MRGHSALALRRANRAPRNLQCEIESIVPGSPASGANIKPGDAVTAVNDVRVISVVEAIKKIKASDGIVKLAILREDDDAHDNGGRSAPLNTAVVAYCYMSCCTAEDAAGGDILRTTMVESLEQPAWQDVFDFDVPADKRYLYIRAFSCKVQKNGTKARKDMLIGEAEVDITEVSLYCLTNGQPYTCRYPLRTTADITSPLIGYAELVLQVGGPALASFTVKAHDQNVALAFARVCAGKCALGLAGQAQSGRPDGRPAPVSVGRHLALLVPSCDQARRLGLAPPRPRRRSRRGPPQAPTGSRMMTWTSRSGPRWRCAATQPVCA